jgi:hypothetical protein
MIRLRGFPSVIILPTKRKVAGELAQPPVVNTTWTPRPRKRPHLFRLVRPRKHRSVAAILAVAPAAPVFIPHRRKPVRRYAVVRPRRHPHIAGIIGARAFLLPPSQPWNWHAQPPPLNFALGTVSQPWNWHGQAATLSFALTGASKAWVWTKNAATLSFALRMGQAWNWAARATVAGGNIPGNVKHGFDIVRQVVWGVVRGVLDRVPLS